MTVKHTRQIASRYDRELFDRTMRCAYLAQIPPRAKADYSKKSADPVSANSVFQLRSFGYQRDHDDRLRTDLTR